MKVFVTTFIGCVLISLVLAGGYGRDDDDDDDECCEMEKEEGSCHEKHDRFYFDKHTKRCESFVHHGCKKNENNFASREDCYKSCNAHANRQKDAETNYFRFKVRMANPYEFYMKNKAEYENAIRVAITTHLPVSTKEIHILKAYAGSTVLEIEVRRSFTDQSIKVFINRIQTGVFKITVAGNNVQAITNQDPEMREYEGDEHRNRRCRKIMMFVIPVIVFIIILVVLIVVIKNMKKKNMRSGPIEVAKDAFQTVWKSDTPEVATIEKKYPPEDFVTADTSIPPPAYVSEAAAPPAYKSTVSLRSAPPEYDAAKEMNVPGTPDV